ncbi:nickel-dependent hydrogenase large subunit [Sedimenticola hydrogenitrophicus]|uniref:nickel-dependent hydrogenase large subunit n=1 Tax=Sedimenticola hydrogenitrophicus TaxID=2967975 RepID=UPI002738D349|nr:nickel-dependent hydrogenase large subunit [Sedimenticola hydrogenitrophicus]
MGNAVGNIEGRLDIGLQLSEGIVTGVDIRSSRPLQTPRIFIGKRVEELLQTLPLLYSVCGTAQAHAAVSACEQALGLAEPESTHGAREALVWLETAKEHLWRVLLEWPGLLGLPPATTGVGEVMQLIQRFRVALFPQGRPFMPGARPVAAGDGTAETVIAEFDRLLREQVFGLPPAQWLELEDVAGLLRWAEDNASPAARMLQRVHDNGWSGLGCCPVGALPRLETPFLLEQLQRADAQRFIAAPQLAGECRETTPFTRALGHPLVAAVVAADGSGLLARLTARLVELAGIPGRLRALGLSQEETADADPAREPVLPAGNGIAQVEAARGLLVHRVVLQEERIARYQILAPTEWNFHPDGVLAEGLKGLQADSMDDLHQQAALLINAIDPCVGYELRIEQD